MKRTKATPVLDWFRTIAQGETLENELVRQFRRSGGKVVGVFDPETPVEILEAAGCMTFAFRSAGEGSTELADAYFKQIICEYTRMTFNQILDERYAFLDGAVFYNNCDHMRRIFDNWLLAQKDSPAYCFFYSPKKRADRAFPFYQAEIAKLVEKTEQRFDVKITPDKLAQAIREVNRTRKLVCQLYELRKGDEVYLDGAEMADVLTAVRSIPRQAANTMLEALVTELKAGDSFRPRHRLMYASHHADRSELMQVIEKEGDIIVVDSLAAGLQGSDVLVKEEGDPMDAILRHYFYEKAPQPRNGYTEDIRKERVLKLIEDYRVEGVVSARLAFCDLWAFEQFMMMGYLKDKGIRHLQLEVGYNLANEGQIRTRMQAFIESLPAKAQA